MQKLPKSPKWYQYLPPWSYWLGIFLILAVIIMAIVDVSLLLERTTQAKAPAATSVIIFVTPTLKPPSFIHVSPTQGLPGTLVTVTGEGWLPGSTVFIYWQNPASGEQTSPLPVLVTNSGSFTTSVVSPSWTNLTNI